MTTCQGDRRLLGIADAGFVLWQDGAFARFPDAIHHAIVAKWTDGDHVPTLMRDLGDSVPGWTRRLTALEWAFIRTTRATCAAVSRVLR